MKFQNLSVKRLFGRVAMELVLSMSGITIALFLVTKQIAVLLTGGALLLCAIVGIFVLTQAFGKRLSQFTTDLCQTLDHMIAGNEAPQRPEDSETQLARIGHRLARLYQIMQENRRRVDEERQELQTLVSDISHQVKTPVSNLKMATDTLLEKPMTEAERTDFIRGIHFVQGVLASLMGSPLRSPLLAGCKKPPPYVQHRMYRSHQRFLRFSRSVLPLTLFGTRLLHRGPNRSFRLRYPQLHW